MTAPEQIGVRELRGNLSRYLRAVRQGARFVIVSRGKPVAEIAAPSRPATARREPGLLKGKIWMADDFDTLPDDMLDAIERD